MTDPTVPIVAIIFGSVVSILLLALPLTDPTFPILAIIFGSVVSILLLALPLHRYKGKISESSVLLRFGLLILLAFGVGSTVFVFFSRIDGPAYIGLAFLFVIPVALCFYCIESVQASMKRVSAERKRVGSG